MCLNLVGTPYILQHCIGSEMKQHFFSPSKLNTKKYTQEFIVIKFGVKKVKVN